MSEFYVFGIYEAAKIKFGPELDIDFKLKSLIPRLLNGIGLKIWHFGWVSMSAEYNDYYHERLLLDLKSPAWTISLIPIQSSTENTAHLLKCYFIKKSV